MRSPVEIRYAGVAIGRSESAQPVDGAKDAFFLVTPDPMPVGTALDLAAGDEALTARVVRVVETGPAGAGMEVRLTGMSSRAAADAAGGDSDGVPDGPSEGGASGEIGDSAGGGDASSGGDANGATDANGNKKKRKRRR